MLVHRRNKEQLILGNRVCFLSSYWDSGRSCLYGGEGLKVEFGWKKKNYVVLLDKTVTLNGLIIASEDIFMVVSKAKEGQILSINLEIPKCVSYQCIGQISTSIHIYFLFVNKLPSFFFFGNWEGWLKAVSNFLSFPFNKKRSKETLMYYWQVHWCVLLQSSKIAQIIHDWRCNYIRVCVICLCSDHVIWWL